MAWLHLEGILNDAMVFVNGKFVSRKFQSYSGFSVDLPAELLKPTTGNVLAVRADERGLVLQRRRAALRKY